MRRHTSEPENETEASNGEIATITPTTPVHMNLRAAITIIAVIVSAMVALTSGYNTLTGAAKALESKQAQLEKRIDGAATKADLRELRYQMREDLLNSVWVCNKDTASGSLSCQLKVAATFVQ